MSKNGASNQPILKSQIDEIKRQYDTITQKVDRQKVESSLLPQIVEWESRAIAAIKSIATNARKNLKQAIDESNRRLKDSLDKIAKELSKTKPGKVTANEVSQMTQLLEDCQNVWTEMNKMKVVTKDLLQLDLIRIHKESSFAEQTDPISSLTPENSAEKSGNNPRPDWTPPGDRKAAKGFEQRNSVPSCPPLQLRAEPAVVFPRNAYRDERVKALFESLETLAPMDKNGAMSGDCHIETTQMESFLEEMFGFKNINGQEIVHGVKAFKLNKPLDSKKPDSMISFPSKKDPVFEMTVAEIQIWQQSYAVYADKNRMDLDKKFLVKALKGLSECGKEAFHMKFVVRVSKCPILMEFDGRIIPRKLDDKWPNLIKLVSVTGVDFAGRIHDVDDILTYLLNWRDVYEIDNRSGYPIVYGGRDFRRKKHGPLGKLNERLLLDDLIRMARLRLRACDLERIQIVVETGIGLGVFAGRSIGIDHTVRALSAIAVRTVLEEDGPNYKNILGVVFALPVFNQDRQNGDRQDTYQAFLVEFDEQKYKGPIPVMIADQDMHRLAVAIARQDFRVSELNPADSHGVFGEYWQNRGPAVEEKLALTTLGLLVQHHLINPSILDPNLYYFI